MIRLSDFQRIYPKKANSQPRLKTSAKRMQAARELNAFLDQMNEASAPLDEAKVDEDVLKEVKAVRRSRKKR